MQPYNVPIVSHDLRQEEFVLQIADTLEYLENVTEDIFGRITKRVQECQQRLDIVNKRTDSAQAKINALKGSKKAIRVFSSAKYPAGELAEVYQSIFDLDNDLKEIKRTQTEISSKHKTANLNSIKDKLQFYSVNIKQKNDGEKTGEGLGKLPKTIDTVSSLLLFNTAENPYKKYVIMDPLAGLYFVSYLDNLNFILLTFFPICIFLFQINTDFDSFQCLITHPGLVLLLLHNSTASYYIALHFFAYHRQGFRCL